MEFWTTLKDTPIPTILVISGIVFLLLGIATIKKPIVIDITPSGRKLAMILGVVLLGIGLYIFSRQISEQSVIETTETPTASATETFTGVASILATETETPTMVTVYSSSDTIHLGDNGITGWAKLSGDCLMQKVQVTLPAREAILSLETLGLETRAIIKINQLEVSIIPPTEGLDLEQWSEKQSIFLAIDYFIDGFNDFQICATPVINKPTFPGELDDFEIRNIQLTIEK